MRYLARKQCFSTGTDALRLFIGLSNSTSRQLRICTQCRYNTAAAVPSPKSEAVAPQSKPKVDLNINLIPKDEWYNVTPNIIAQLTRRLHMKEDHPISITRSIIESQFPHPTYKYYNEFSPVVSTYQNFDSLEFPADHPGRSKTDTYYFNQNTVLRTHTSAHQAEIFRANESDGYLISADVYRRDAIDRSHYPVFHQMEGARVWDRTKVPNGDIAAAIWKDIDALPQHTMKVEDPNPSSHPERNPLQGEHSMEEAEAIAAHLKRSLELMVVEIFSRAKTAATQASIASESVPEHDDTPLQVRWVEAYFPFTSPSWELEIFWQGAWLEVLGCGVVKQGILNKAGVPSQLGWAFGIGLERIAMLLFDIPDIRLFWSQDPRFLSQFAGLSSDFSKLKRFLPFSKYPASTKDISFWLAPTEDGKENPFHENDLTEVVRDICGDVVEDVKLADEYENPKTGKKSLLYRITYRSLEKTLTRKMVMEYHEKIGLALAKRCGVEIRLRLLQTKRPKGTQPDVKHPAKPAA